MSESVGKRLAQIRVERGLSIDEVARVIKLRPEKILALESNQYAAFPSNAYAKGFLKNYAAYLKVDITDDLQSLDSTFLISTADYQYLINSPDQSVAEEPVRRPLRAPSVIPLLVVAVLIAGGLVFLWVQSIANRIFEEPKKSSRTVRGELVSTPVLPVVAADIAEPLGLALESPILNPSASGNAQPVVSQAAADREALQGAITGDPADHDVVTPVYISTPEPVVSVSADSVRTEILVASTKKTWVSVRRDDPKTPPIFSDYIYPAAPPLKLRGTCFYVETVDPASIKITKNGVPIAYQSPRLPIQ